MRFMSQMEYLKDHFLVLFYLCYREMTLKALLSENIYYMRLQNVFDVHYSSII